MSWGQAENGRLGRGAAYYASIGWEVFPVWGIVGGLCGAGHCGMKHPEPKDMGKHPLSRLVPDGMKAATTDVANIEAWWSAEVDANIGVRCRESGFVVIDVDPRHDGDASWLKLEELVEGDLPPTTMAKTGEYSQRGGGIARGRHYFYKVPPGVKFWGDLKRQGLPGIDIKHDGYVLLNPSRHASGVCYEWVPGHEPWSEETPMADCPAKLLELISRGKRRTGGEAAEVALMGGSFEYDGKRIDVEKLLEEGLDPGARNNTMIAAGVAIANKLGWKTPMERLAVRAMMDKINNASADPMDDKEMETLHENSIDAVTENPPLDLRWDGLDAYLESAKSWDSMRGEEAVAETEAKLAEEDRFTRAIEGGLTAAPPAVPDDAPLIGDPDAVDAVGKEGGRPVRSTTDLGNGRRLADRYNRRMRYTTGVGWVVWNGTCWVPDPERLLVQENAKVLGQLVVRDAATLGEGHPRADEYLKWASQAKSTARVDSAVKMAQSDPRVLTDVDVWDANDYLFGVKNGVIDLRTGDLITNHPDLFITHQAAVAYTPGMRNLRFEQFLDFATGGDKELQHWMQLAFGYTLTGLRNQDLMFVVHGLGGTGKNTLVEAVELLLGSYAEKLLSSVIIDDKKSSNPQQDQYYWASLIGKRMAWIDELPEIVNLKEDAVKALTGSAKTTGRNPGERPFTFDSKIKLWVSTNHLPRITDEAMWRRLRPIPFNRKPEVPDPGLKEYMFSPEGALPAILSWCVDGAVQYLNSSKKDPLGWCKAVWDSAALYREQEDRVGLFLRDECRAAEGSEVLLRELHRTYQGWAEDRGERPMTILPFTRRLEEHGYVADTAGRRAMVSGLSLLPKAVESTNPWDGLIRSAR